MASRKPGKSRKKDQRPRRLFRKGRALTLPPGQKILYEPAGREKMSEVLEEFVEPYLDMVESESDYRKLLHLAILAWNAALLPEEQRSAMIVDALDEGLRGVAEADRALAQELVMTMVRRKLEHFAANQRAIISFELTDTGDGYHLLVASSL